MLTFSWLLVGLFALVAGGELLVRGASTVARRAGMSPLFIGVVLVGFGTSMPELVTSLQAALDGSPAIAVGNVVGSNIANILLILGLAGLIYPISVSPASFRRDAIAVALSAVACAVLVYSGTIERLAGLGLLMGLGVYLWLAIKQESAADTAMPDDTGRIIGPLFLAVFGVALTIGGAKAFVHGAIDLASALNLSEAFIGLTVVAVGTSLPELVTSVMAALKKQSDLAFGNIIGSNIYNILGILGLTALVRPLDNMAGAGGYNLWVLLAATTALVIFAAARFRIARWEAALMLGGYVLWLVWPFLA